MHSCMKQLRGRAGAPAPRKELSVAPSSEPGPASFTAWLEEPGRAERRPMAKCKRMLAGIAKWDLRWMRAPHVVCYERAAGRIRKERPGCRGRPDERFTRGLLQASVLHTAVASGGDHRVLLQPGKRPRFLTVREEARAMGLPDDNKLARTLRRPPKGSAREAVTWLGRAIHVGVARLLVKEMVARGWISHGLRYGSAYSGIDTFAAALEEELGGGFEYLFASELGVKQRGVLLQAWGERGLSEGRVREDAEGGGAVAEESVDLWVASPDCGEHSKRNHARDSARQTRSVEEISASLRYVSERRPGVVIVENVDEASIVGPLGAMLRRIEGYEWEDGVLDAGRDAREPVARSRHFWVGKRVW